jgi:hypothetical protein
MMVTPVNGLERTHSLVEHMKVDHLAAEPDGPRPCVSHRLVELVQSRFEQLRAGTDIAVAGLRQRVGFCKGALAVRIILKDTEAVVAGHPLMQLVRAIDGQTLAVQSS